MAGIIEKIYRLTVFGVILFSGAVCICVCVHAGNNDGVAATLTNFSLPDYRGNDQLQFILYGEKATNLGALIHIDNPVVDIVQDHLTDISTVEPLDDLRIPEEGKPLKPVAAAHDQLYPLGAANWTVASFWKKIPHSRAIIAAPDATYDKNKKLLRGDSHVVFRSRIVDGDRTLVVDADGVGFDADQEERTIHVRSRVKVVIRFDPEKVPESNPECEHKHEQIQTEK